MNGKVTLAVVGVLLAVALSACGGGQADRAPAASLGDEQVQAIAVNMLTAYNTGDYRAFSRDLSLPARLIVDEDVFADFRTENLPVTGPYLAVSSVEREPNQQDPAHTSYLVQAQFQYQDVVVLVMTVSGNGTVDGLELYPRPLG
ncbi:MAG TPA: hypothetical protein VJ735_09675 [Actinomycetes bacterium]|nr:hypothetical protein [Actinomycetes bacterium]